MAKAVAAKNSKADKVNKKEKKAVVESSSDSSSDSDSSSSSSSSSSDSSDSDSSDSESEKEEVKKVEKKVVKKVEKKVEKKAESSDSDSSSSSSSSDSDSSDSSDSDSDSDDEKEDKKDDSDKKRKADAEETPVIKKVKAEDGSAAPASGASTTVFVGGLSWNVDNDWLRTEFAECGEIADVRVITDRDSQRSKGYGYVEFANAEGAQAALALAGKEIDGRAIRVDISEGRPKKEAKTFNTPTGEASDTLFVGNLSFSATEDDLRGAFAECGEILSIRLPTDRESGQPKGFGYIQFSSIDEAKAAIAWNGSDLAGRPCRLDFAGKKPERAEGGGGFGGRGGARGGRGGGRGGRGGFGGDRGGRGGARGGRGASSTNRGGFGSFQGSKVTF